MVTEEIWKVIPGIPGYEVSNLGNVRESECTIKLKTGEEVVKPCKNLKPYRMKNSFYIRLGNLKCPLHRLVAAAFLGEASDGKNEINFKDGNHRNCAVDNIEWSSRSDIWKNQIANGTRPVPANYTGQKIICVDTGDVYGSIKELCEVVVMPRSIVTRYINNGIPIRGKIYVRKKDIKI